MDKNDYSTTSISEGETLLPTPQHVAAYVAAINFIFAISDDAEASRFEAAEALGKWVTGSLLKPEEKIVPKAVSATSSTCPDCCKKNGKWDFYCLIICIWTGVCPI